MIAAKALKVSKTSQLKAAKTLGMSNTRISQAKMVIDFAPELVDSVVAGATPPGKARTATRWR